MQGQIDQYLEEKAQKNQFEIIYSCESGGKVWGYGSASKKKQYSYIYYYPEDDKFSFDKQYGVIENTISDDVEIQGRDLRNVLKMISTSSPEIMEILSSPKVLDTDDCVNRHLIPIAQGYFCPKKTITYFLDNVSANLKSNFKGSSIDIYSYFSIIRSLLSAKWVATYLDIPPIHLKELMGLIEKDDSINAEINKLLLEENAADGNPLINRLPELDMYVTREALLCRQRAEDFPESIFSPSALHVFYDDFINDNMLDLDELRRKIEMEIGIEK